MGDFSISACGVAPLNSDTTIRLRLQENFTGDVVKFSGLFRQININTPVSESQIVGISVYTRFGIGDLTVSRSRLSEFNNVSEITIQSPKVDQICGEQVDPNSTNYVTFKVNNVRFTVVTGRRTSDNRGLVNVIATLPKSFVVST